MVLLANRFLHDEGLGDFDVLIRPMTLAEESEIDTEEGNSGDERICLDATRRAAP
jgi:hypothetical protein